MFTFDNISLDRILVPVDGSNQSKEALRRAAFIARQFDASITLLSVVEFGKVMSGVQQVSTGGYMPEHLTAGAEEMLKKMAKLVPEDIHVETEALLGGRRALRFSCHGQPRPGENQRYLHGLCKPAGGAGV